MDIMDFISIISKQLVKLELIFKSISSLDMNHVESLYFYIRNLVFSVQFQFSSSNLSSVMIVSSDSICDKVLSLVPLAK